MVFVCNRLWACVHLHVPIHWRLMVASRAHNMNKQSTVSTSVENERQLSVNTGMKNKLASLTCTHTHTRMRAPEQRAISKVKSTKPKKVYFLISPLQRWMVLTVDWQMWEYCRCDKYVIASTDKNVDWIYKQKTIQPKPVTKGTEVAFFSDESNNKCASQTRNCIILTHRDTLN